MVSMDIASFVSRSCYTISVPRAELMAIFRSFAEGRPTWASWLSSENSLAIALKTGSIGNI